MRRLPLTIRLIFAALTAAARAEIPAHPLVNDGSRLESPEINEASGLAASPRDPSSLWHINDSGGTAHLHLTDAKGARLGRVLVRGARNIDWEDLASFKLDGRGYLLIADTGDNASTRPTSTLYIVQEPAFPDPAKRGAGIAKVAWKIDFTYEDGPRDCESVAVDVREKKILLLSKRTSPPALYELPLRPEPDGAAAVAGRIGETTVRQPPGTFPHPFGSQPTAMDFSPDGRAAVVLTYVTAFIFHRAPEESWPRAFAKPPLVLETHGLAQAEAIAWSEKGIFLTSEGENAPLLRYSAAP